MQEHKNSIATVSKLLNHFKIKVTKQTIRAEMELHPDYPSLLTISDVLKKWDVHNCAYQIETGDLHKVSCPFIAHLSTNGGEFVIVQSIDDEEVTISNEKWTGKRYKIMEFTKLYSGSILAVEPGVNAGEANYSQRRYQEILTSYRMPLLIICGLATLFAGIIWHTSYLSNFNWLIGTLTLLKCIGLATSVLLLTQSIDANNPLIQRLCSGSKKANCNAILSSKASKVFNGLTWSEIGFFYFAGTLFVLLFSTSSTVLLQYLGILTCLSLPYTFYSVFYQLRVAKQWCVLCCTVQAILWLELIPLMPYLALPFNLPEIQELSSLMIGLAAPVIFWLFIKPYLLKAQQVKQLNLQLKKFKYNTNLFQKLLTDQPRYTSPDQEHSIVLGNPEAEHIVTMVSNPFCAPCSKAHQMLNDWLQNRDDLQLRIVFSTHDLEEGSKITVAKHLMSLNAAVDKGLVQQALHDWYNQEQKSYEAWSKKYPINNEFNNSDSINKQKEWCDMINVEFTPTILLNGYKLPSLYQLDEVKYFI